jgi:hypothetical protein
MIRIKKIRDSARGEDCTVNSPWCNYDSSTVVFAHYGEPGEKGAGLKPDDTSGVYACSDCHDWLDGRVSHSSVDKNDLHDKCFYWFRAMRRTWALLITNGVLK